MIYKLKRTCDDVTYKMNRNKKLLKIIFGAKKQRLLLFYKTHLFNDIQHNNQLCNLLTKTDIFYFCGMVPSVKKSQISLVSKMFQNSKYIITNIPLETNQMISQF